MSAAAPLVLTFPAEVGNGVVGALEKEARRLLGTERVSLVVDLGATTFLCSAGLGLLVLLSKQLHDRGGSIALARPRAPVARLLRVVGLEEVLPSFSAVEDAAAHVAASRAG